MLWPQPREHHLLPDQTNDVFRLSDTEQSSVYSENYHNQRVSGHQAFYSYVCEHTHTQLNTYESSIHSLNSDLMPTLKKPISLKYKKIWVSTVVTKPSSSKVPWPLWKPKSSLQVNWKDVLFKGADCLSTHVKGKMVTASPGKALVFFLSWQQMPPLRDSLYRDSPHSGLIIHWKDRRPIHLQRLHWETISTVPSKWIGFVKPSISFNVQRTKNSDWEIVWTSTITPLCRLKHWAHLEICKMHTKSSNCHTKLASQVIKQKLEWGQERGKHLFDFLVSRVLC